jgi:hypothetical protein
VSVSSKPRDLLKQNLAGANKIAKRLAVSLRRVADMMPLDAKKIDGFGGDGEERLDASIFRFNLLTALVQDHITRGILLCEEEDASGSKRDQRHLMEKFGALKPGLNFGTLAELRNRIAHHYPDDNAKQAEIVNEIFEIMRSAGRVQLSTQVCRRQDLRPRARCSRRRRWSSVRLEPELITGSTLVGALLVLVQ